MLPQNVHQRRARAAAHHQHDRLAAFRKGFSMQITAWRMEGGRGAWVDLLCGRNLKTRAAGTAGKPVRTIVILPLICCTRLDTW